MVFLIDASRAMRQEAPRASLPAGGTSGEPEPKTYLDVAVACAQTVLRSRIVSAPSDKQGVVFFHSRERRGPDDAAHGLNTREGVYVEQRMAVPSARRIQDLVEMCGEEGNRRFEAKIGHGDDHAGSFYDALLKAHHIAREMLNDHAAGARVAKRVLLFTNRDAPLGPDEDGRELIGQWREFRNVHDIDVVLLPLSRDADPATEGSEASALDANVNPADPTQSFIDGFTQTARGARDDAVAGSEGRRLHEFDASQFYHNLLTCTADDVGDDRGGGHLGGSRGGSGRGHELVVCAADRMQSLTLAFRKKSKKRRRVRATTLRFGPDPRHAISVVLYAPIAEAKKPKETKLHSRDLAVVHTRTDYIGPAGDFVQPEALTHKTVEYGGQSVKLSASEIAEAKRACGVDGVHLLGFRPASDVARWLQTSRVARFMSPDEETTQQGATAAFTALVEAMVAKGRVAIAAYARVGDRNAGVRCVALVPSTVAIAPSTGTCGSGGGGGENAAANAVNGLHVVFLPFLDDVRHPERAHATRGASQSAAATSATEEQIAAAEETVEAMMVHEYDPLEITNPTLTRHYRMLELQALDKAWVEEAEGMYDLTLPPSAETLEEVGARAAVERFKLAVYGPSHDAEAAEDEAKGSKGGGGGTKRKAPAGGLAGALMSVDDIDFKGLTQAGELETLTVAKLKEYCATNGLPVSGAKAALVSRVTEHINDRR